jgi:hypothetical protein
MQIQQEETRQFYLLISGEEKGPYTFVQVQSLWKSGSLNLNDLYHSEGGTEWSHLSGLRTLLDGESSHVIYRKMDDRLARMDKSLSKIWGVLAFLLILAILYVIAWGVLLFMGASSDHSQLQEQLRNLQR